MNKLVKMYKVKHSFSGDIDFRNQYVIAESIPDAIDKVRYANIGKAHVTIPSVKLVKSDILLSVEEIPSQKPNIET